MNKNWNSPIHPGEILAGELEEIGMNALELSKRLGVPDNRIYQILDGKRNITADTALRLGKFFGTGPDFWINLQKAYELDIAKQKIGDGLQSIIPIEHKRDRLASHP